MVFKVVADLGQLSKIREYVTESATALGVDPAVFDDLRLAVDEAVTNVLIHGYEGSGDIELDISADGSDLIVRLRDQAPPFDSTLAKSAESGPPEVKEKPGGFGLFLIERAMDKLIHRNLENGNELTMIKCDVIGGTAKSGIS
jgi:serine/threonine-protein kinase RsbW